MSKKIYKTTLIDEVVFFAMYGVMSLNTQRKADRAGEWCFQVTPSFKKLHFEFWNGTPVVNLHKWMSIRSQIKYQQKAIPLMELENDVLSTLKNYVNNDRTYWFRDSDGIMKKVLIGERVTKDSIHWKRMNKGNMFIDKAGNKKQL